MTTKKKKIKLATKRCTFCDEECQSILDCHRIIPGKDGGKYVDHNIVVTCSNCHRKIHAGEITIDKKYQTTKGLMIAYSENGKEKMKPVKF